MSDILQISLRSTQPFKLEGVDTLGSTPQEEATHDGMLRSEGGAPGGLTPAVCMALRRFRPPTGEANHDGMLR